MIDYTKYRKSLKHFHDYSESKAQETLGKMEDFIQDAEALYNRITGEVWESL